MSSVARVLAKPGSIKPHKKFEAEAYILTKEEGGRHTPFFTNYRPPVLFPHDRRDRDRDPETRAPRWSCRGDNVEVTVDLITPIAMEEKLRFAIREGGRTVGAGVVSKISRVGPDGQS